MDCRSEEMRKIEQAIELGDRGNMGSEVFTDLYMLLMEVLPKLDVSGIFFVTEKSVNTSLSVSPISVQFSLIAGV